MPLLGTRRALWAALALALIRTVLSTYWALTLPPFEAHDETGHFAYARYIAQHGRLPEPGQRVTGWFDESHQPPLYYLLAAAGGRPLVTSETYTPTMNPFFLRGDKLAGVNAALHDPDAEALPGPQRFLLAGRVLSAAFSGGAVILVFLALRCLLPGKPAVTLAATGLAAFNPTWVFLGGAMTNDALVALTGSLVLWTSIRLIQAERLRLRDAVWAGAGLGLALLSKNNAITLAPFALGAAVWAARRATTIRPTQPARFVGAFASAAALTAGWWYLRNLLVIGRPLSDRESANVILREVSPFFEIVTKRDPLEFTRILIDNSFRTFWGQFGWGTIGLPDPIYLALAAIAALAAIGMIATLRQAWSTLPPWLLFAFVALVAALPLYRAIFFNTPTLVPGRYLLPGIGAIGGLLAIGLFGLGRLGASAAGAGVTALLLISAIAPSQLILPEYRQPARLTLAEVTQRALPVDYTYDGRAKLIGYQLDRDRLAPGQELGVTLYWQVLATFDRPYTMGLHLIDLHVESRASINTWPGRGNFPPNLWKPGDIFADKYLVKIPLDAGAPFVASIRPKLHNFFPSSPESGDFQYLGDLPVTDATGQLIEPVLGMVAVESSLPASTIQPIAEFGSSIRLDNLVVNRGRAPTEIEIQLTWQALSKPSEPLVVFVHAIDAAGNIVAQNDSEPGEGLYPTTAWRAEERVLDRHSILLPNPLGDDSVIRLAVGLYRRLDLQRLSAARPQGERLPADQLMIEMTIAQGVGGRSPGPS